MKKTLLLLAAFATISLTAQTTIFSDDFESYPDFEIATIGGWTLVDGEGGTTWGFDTYDFANEGYIGSAIIFNPSATTPSAAGTAYDTHGGAKGLYFVASGASSSTTPNDDWAITPQISIAGNGQVSFWAKSLTDTYGLERIQMAVSTTGVAPADFTVIDIDQDLDTQNTKAYQEIPTDWTEITANLSAYANSNIYIAIHYVTNDAFVLHTDDFVVTDDSTAAVNDNILASSVKIYPTATTNNFTINNQSNITLTSVSLYDVNGRVVLTNNLDNLIGQKSINVSNLSSGLYFVEMNSADAKLVKKLIIK